MGIISSSVLLYIILILLSFVTGITYWVRARYRVGAVFSLIFSLLGPLLAILVIAQGENLAEAYKYIMAEVSTGNSWARIVVFIHIYLLGWLLFLLISMIIKTIRSPLVKEKFLKLFSRDA